MSDDGSGDNWLDRLGFILFVLVMVALALIGHGGSTGYPVGW